MLSQEMDLDTQVQILDKAIFISHWTNTLEKGMNPTILPQFIGKKLGRQGSLTLVSQPV